MKKFEKHTELKLEKKNLKNLTLDDSVIPMNITDKVAGGTHGDPTSDTTLTINGPAIISH